MQRDLGEPRLEARLADVDVQRVEDLVLAVDEHLVERVELSRAPLERARAAGREGRAQAGDDRSGVGHARNGSARRSASTTRVAVLASKDERAPPRRAIVRRRCR